MIILKIKQVVFIHSCSTVGAVSALIGGKSAIPNIIIDLMPNTKKKQTETGCHNKEMEKVV